MKSFRVIILFLMIFQRSLGDERIVSATDQWSSIIVFEYVDNETSRATVLKNEGPHELKQDDLQLLRKRFARELGKFDDVAIVYSLKVLNDKVTTMESQISGDLGKKIRQMLNNLEKSPIGMNRPHR